MAEYLIQGESLTAIADEVRTLSGISDSLTPDAMATNLSDANTEVSSQADLISQIATALQGKAAGSGGGVTLPTLTNPASAENLESGYELIDGEGNIVVGTHTCSGSGGSTGVCPSLTITGPSSIFVPKYVVSQNGAYKHVGLATNVLPVTISNIDVGSIIYFKAQSPSWPVLLDSYSNVELLIDDMSENNICVFKCTSASSATISLSEDD